MKQTYNSRHYVYKTAVITTSSTQYEKGIRNVGYNRDNDDDDDDDNAVDN